MRATRRLLGVRIAAPARDELVYERGELDPLIGSILLHPRAHSEPTSEAAEDSIPAR